MPKYNNKRNAHPANAETQRQTETTVDMAVCAYPTLLKMAKRCHRRVGYKNSVSRFDMLVMTKVYQIYLKLIRYEYHTGVGITFEVFEPKYRIVTSTTYSDRIPQASFVQNCFYPRIIPNLIDNTFACIKGRGVDKARSTFKEMIRSADEEDMCFCTDMSGYFKSIRHDKLFREIGEYIDGWDIFFFRDVVNCEGADVGLSLGSEMNQLSATFLLNRLDHRLSEIGKYVRYMDDIRFVGPKEACIQALKICEEETSKLSIKMSKKKTYIQPIKRPVQFLGYTFLRHPTGRVTMKRLSDKLNHDKRKVRKMHALGVPLGRVADHVQSERAVLKKGNRNTLIKYDKFIKSLYGKEIEYENSEGKHRRRDAQKADILSSLTVSRHKRGGHQNRNADPREIFQQHGDCPAPQETDGRCR